jgi:hypothetical protein
VVAIADFSRWFRAELKGANFKKRGSNTAIKRGPGHLSTFLA